MAKIHGTYEYDDDDLTPGKKKEGGLHQNLFDNDGNLKGSARFIPDEEQPEEPYRYADTPYIDPSYEEQLAAEAEERRREREREENAELIAKVLMALATVAYVKAKPHAQRLWREKVGPAAQARRESRALRKSERRARKSAATRSESTEDAVVVETEFIEGTVVEPTNDLVIASQEYRRNMSSSEAQARYLMALAAKAFSDEQLRLVTNANIMEDEDFRALERALAELPPGQVASLIDRLELYPAMLADDAFDLNRFLAETAEQLPLEEQRGE